MTQLSPNRIPIAGPSESMNVKRGTSQPQSRRPAQNPTQNRRRRLLMESLESRHLMAGGLGSTSPIGGIGIVDNVQPRNVGAVGVDAFRYTETELTGGRRLNDNLATAEFLPLGTGSGQQDTMDVTGSLSLASFSNLNGALPEDVDYYRFNLRAGDILDIAGLGSVGRFDVLFSNGSQWFGTLSNIGSFGSYPPESPLQTLGNAVAAQVVPFDGTYYLRVASNFQLTGPAYTLGLRVYRPVLESQPIGTQQTLYLDFEGGFFQASDFFRPTPLNPVPVPGTIQIPSLIDSLGSLGFPVPAITDPNYVQIENTLIDGILRRVNEDFNLFITQNGGNGNYNQTGVAGQFGIRILNSRDHADPGMFAPNVTRMFVGGTSTSLGFPPGGLYGLSSTVDVGNFSTNDVVITVLDAIGIDALTLPLSPASSRLDIAAQGIALTISHEAAHTFGIFHTDRFSGIPSIIDENVGLVDDYELGLDGIFGTFDDVNIPFPVRDRFSLVEGFLGNNYVSASLAWGLATGTQGSSLTGRVYNDTNSNGSFNSGEQGLAGVTVFVDRDNDGALDAGETSTTTNADGTYSLAVGPGSIRVVAIAPGSFAGTSAAQTVTVGTTGASNVNLGFTRVSSDVTGTVWADLDGNAIRDAGEPVSEGVYVYLDLDGDNRIDIGEPWAQTDANGNYKVNFPGPGTYIIREVLPSGFEQTFPLIPQSSIQLPNGQTPDEHRVVFNGSALTGNFNFGNRPNLDFGDAPDSYRTTLAAGGPSHGILPGLSLGGAPDREIDGRPTVGADGDDVTGVVGAGGTVIDDEDGVVVLTPIGPGANATFQVTLNNTTGSTGFLQGWFDFNQNGSFADVGEHVVVNSTATGVTPITVAIPSTVTPGSLYARFRYSLTQNLGIGGPAETGEVEDYLFTVNASANLANNDDFTITRNSQANVLNVLDNDFQTSTNQLRITSVNVLGSTATNPITPPTRGTVSIASGQRSILYTPPVGFTGRDTFFYTVTSATGQTATARVDLNVTFVSNSPIAIDDTFTIPDGSTNIALNVLDNDVPSLAGGLTIISVTPGSQGGTTRTDGGSQAIRYTPRAGFTGTEEFTYSISDGSGQVSSATVTVNQSPGSRADDLVEYSIKFFDATNTDREITDIQSGTPFLVRVFAEDLQVGASNTGVFSAFLDLLYTDELVTVLPSTATPGYNFAIQFGADFRIDVSSADATIPGLLDEVGSLRNLTANDGSTSLEGPIELFTVRMQAVAPGVAVFKGNPADVVENETTLFDRQAAVTIAQQRFGIAELNILQSGTSFTTAIDDSFLNAVDSLGQPIRGGVSATLDVLANDNLGPTGTLDSITILRAPGFGGSAVVGPNNTIIYTPGSSVNSYDSFSYAIVTADGVRSSAEVNVTVGNAAANDTLEYSLRFVDGTGNPITGNIPVGTRFGVQVIVDDLRQAIEANPLGVFAAFTDILYNANLATPANTIQGDPFNFDVVFGPFFDTIDPETGNVRDAFGLATAPGIIDELGAIVGEQDPANIPPGAVAGDPVLLATLFFDAIAAGTLTVKTNPADSSPQRDSLFFTPDEPILVDRIRYSQSSIAIGGASGEGEGMHNAVTPADVNDDGRISPLDALAVINQISRSRRGEGETAANSLRRFVDVTGDGRVTPLDALQVINAISKRNRTATPVVEENPVVVPTLSTETYLRLAELRARMAASFAASPPSFSPSSLPAEGMGADDSDEQEEDVFELLARDISGVWQ